MNYQILNIASPEKDRNYLLNIFDFMIRKKY